MQPASETGPDNRPNFTYELSPGDEYVDYFSIRNLGNSPLDLNIYATDAFTNDSGGFDLLAGDANPRDVGSWIELDVSQVTIAPGELRVVPFTLTVPRDADVGDHAGGIVATLTTDPAPDNGPGSQVRVEYRVGSRVYLRVAGEVAPELAIEDLNVAQDWSWNPFGGRDVQVKYTVRNTGNVRMTARPAMKVDGFFGVQLRTVDLQETPEILPGGSFTGEATLRRVPPAFRLNAQLSLDARVAGDATAETSTIAQISRAAAAWSLPITQGVAVAWIALSAYLIWRLRTTRRAAIARTFAPESVAELIERLNHEDDGRAASICASVLGQADISDAQIAGLDPDGATLLATVGAEATPVRVKWRKQVTSPEEIERELGRLSKYDGSPGEIGSGAAGSRAE